MRFALLLPILALGCSARRNAESLVLQEAVADDPGPSGTAGCPWTAIESARIEEDTLWINDGPWSVRSPAAAEAFAGILAVCGAAEVVPAFRAWREAEREAVERRRKAAGPDSAAVIGATVLAGAIATAADPDHPERVSHAIRDQNLLPVPSAPTPPADAELERARQALLDALTPRPAPAD